MLRSPRASPRRRLLTSAVAAVAGVVFIASVIGYTRTTDDSAGIDPGDPTTTSGATASTDTTTTTTTTSAPAPATSSTAPPRRGIEGFGSVAYTVTPAGGEPVPRCGLLADTRELQARGMMGQRDLGGYDGMVFPFPEDTRVAFYMANVPVPLSVAFFASDGSFISAADMPVCNQGAQCPRYTAPSAFRIAIETLQGRLDDLGIGPGSTLRITGSPC